METMSVTESLLERSFVYRLWQAPFAAQKFRPVMKHNDLRFVRRVLDVACGPGTNTKHFVHSDYVGIDINERYVQDGRRRHGRTFIAADALNYTAAPADRFDFILVNSFLHHLSSEDVFKILLHLRSLLTEDGHIHILELALPQHRSVARLLARWDRGKFARPLAEWKGIFGRLFEPVVFEPYVLTGGGATLWNMVYFKGRCRK
jgi:SAM-dependent methyltransferase